MGAFAKGFVPKKIKWCSSRAFNFKSYWSIRSRYFFFKPIDCCIIIEGRDFIVTILCIELYRWHCEALYFVGTKKENQNWLCIYGCEPLENKIVHSKNFLFFISTIALFTSTKKHSCSGFWFLIIRHKSRTGLTNFYHPPCNPYSNRNVRKDRTQIPRA